MKMALELAKQPVIILSLLICVVVIAAVILVAKDWTRTILPISGQISGTIILLCIDFCYQQDMKKAAEENEEL